MERDFQSMKKKHSDACADRDNLEAAYKQMQASFSKVVHNFEDTRKELEGEVKRVCKEKQELYAQLEDAAVKNTALETRLEEVTAELLKHEMGHYKRECEEWKQTADELADQLKDAHERIAEQQRTIVDCSDTITTLKTTMELRPQFSNLWQLLKDTGMIIDTEGGIHNYE
jgi:predicted  nucleic acid-binding Zn-ribbon protein